MEEKIMQHADSCKGKAQQTCSELVKSLGYSQKMKHETPLAKKEELT